MPATETISLEEELARLRACLGVAWGWMIAKGADEAALMAVGYLEVQKHPTVDLEEFRNV